MGTNDRELDKQVAEQVLGHTVVGERKGTLKERTREGQVRPLRPYSSDMTAAWEVARRIKITLLPIADGNWFALAGNPGGWKHPAEFWEYLQKAYFAAGGAAVSLSAAEAICLAALKAVEKRKSCGLGRKPLPEPRPLLEYGRSAPTFR